MNNIIKLSKCYTLGCCVHNLYFLLLINKEPVSLFINTANYQLIIAFLFSRISSKKIQKKQKKIQL